MEVFYNGIWGTVCDDNVNLAVGDVVCRELGYLRALRVYRSAVYGQGSGKVGRLTVVHVIVPVDMCSSVFSSGLRFK